MASEEDIRVPDQSFNEQLISNEFDSVNTHDSELNDAIQQSLNSYFNQQSNLEQTEKFNRQIEKCKEEEYQRILLESFEKQKIKENLIQERETNLRPVTCKLCQLRLKNLNDILNEHIQTGFKIKFKFKESFQNELKPSLFKLINNLFEEEEETYDDDDSDYEYNE